MIGAMPPPKISPAPTTTPIAAETSPRGADSVAIGPVISATLPRQKNEQTNSATNNGSTVALVFANHHTETVAPTKPRIASGLRPRRSDSPGQPNWPKKPPNPSAEATSPVEIAVSAQRNHIAVRLRIGQNDVMVFSRLLEGPFPNYEQVIPKSHPKTLVVPRIELREALDRVATHSDNITHQVRVALATNEVRLSVNTADVGAGEETVEAKYDGEEIEVGYNAIYLLDILKSIETDNVVFRLNTSMSAGIVEPDGALADKDESILCLIMPLRLSEPVAVG